MKLKKKKLSPEAILSLRILDPKGFGGEKALIMESGIQSAVATDGRVMYVCPFLYYEKLADKTINPEWLKDQYSQADERASLIPPGSPTKVIEGYEFSSFILTFQIHEWMEKLTYRNSGKIFFEFVEHETMDGRIMCTSEETKDSLFAVNLAYIAMLADLVKIDGKYHRAIKIQTQMDKVHENALKVTLDGLDGVLYIMPMYLKEKTRREQEERIKGNRPKWTGD